MPELDEINKNLADFQEELEKIKSASVMVDGVIKTAKLTLSESKKIMEELIASSKKATDGAIAESKKLNESASLLFDVVDTLMKKLDKVDFPTRLDLLDISIQNIHSRFDTVERNLKDDISLIKEKLNKSHKISLLFSIFLMLLTGSTFVIILIKFVLP